MASISLQDLRNYIAALAGIGIAISVPQIAAAAEAGNRCYAPSELKQLMDSEGQKLVVFANRGTKDTSNSANDGRQTYKFNAELFYYNPSDHNGYIVSADKPLGTRPDCEQIVAKLEDVILFDARIDGVDPLAKIDGNKDLAVQECREGKTDMSKCFHNDRLEQLRAQGYNTYFQGTVKNFDANGRSLPPTRVTLTGPASLGRPLGYEYVSTVEGASFPSADYSQVLYAPEGNQILEVRGRRKQSP